MVYFLIHGFLSYACNSEHRKENVDSLMISKLSVNRDDYNFSTKISVFRKEKVMNQFFFFFMKTTLLQLK